MPHQFPISVAILDGFTWIRCEGKGSFISSPPLKQYGEARVAAGERLLVIDLAACSGMDSTFMGTLAGLAKKIGASNGGALHVAVPGERNRSSLEDLGLSDLLGIDPPGAVWSGKVDEARAATVPLLATGPVSNRQLSQQVFDAHQTLSDASEANNRKFADLMQMLGKELSTPPAEASGPVTPNAPDSQPINSKTPTTPPAASGPVAGPEPAAK